MKRITAVAFFFTLASILGANTAFSQSREARVSVPFSFTVGSTVLPAGIYSITSVSESLIEIQNRKTHTTVLTLASGARDHSKHGAELVFDKYAGRYFLRDIHCGYAAINVSLPATKTEKTSRMEEAELDHGNDRVLIAAK